MYWRNTCKELIAAQAHAYNSKNETEESCRKQYIKEDRGSEKGLKTTRQIV
jgi:hypothetical protein